MGGYLSMSFGLMRPDLVKALIICDTGPGNRKPASRAAWNESALDARRRSNGRGSRC